MTAPPVHLYRLLKWGRILARHGALRGIERDPNTPKPVRRIARIARFGARIPTTPRYADAFQAIGPAAIKLGQTLATRPDLVGEEAAHDLLRLQDALPPLSFAVIRERIESSYGRPLETFFASIDETPVGAASIAQVHRAVTTEGAQVAVKVLRPGVEAEFARAIETYEWAAAQVEGMQTQPHLLLLQKTMVMVEGVARGLDPEINLWETSAPFVREWIRTELGPEAAVADRIITDLRTLARLPQLLRNIELRYPTPGGAPPAPPLREIEVVRVGGGWRYAAVAVLAAAASAAAMWIAFL